MYSPVVMPQKNNSPLPKKRSAMKSLHSFNLPTPALSLLLAATLLLTACDKKEAPAAAANSAGGAANIAAKTTDPMLIELTPEMTKAFRVEPATMADIAIEQKVSGRIEANERLTMRIGSSVTGRVMQVFAEVGDRVKAGQSLATLSSPELTNAQLSFLRALSMSSLAERAIERAKALVAADVIGTAELQRREVELSVARAELRAAHDQLLLIGLREETIEKLRQTGSIASEVNIRATRSGVVIERKVSQGQVAQLRPSIRCTSTLRRRSSQARSHQIAAASRKNPTSGWVSSARRH
jgi:cobalt-zinc-cadmium efflux system membrane fusion protein